jgi:recombinase
MHSATHAEMHALAARLNAILRLGSGWMIHTDLIRSRAPNLLLGLKGSMAEFELGLLRQRARAAFEQKVSRGFTLWEVSVGFIRTEEGRIEKTPDRQVQQAITNVFHKFHQLGSARQATIWFREEQIPLPHAKLGTAGREVFWALPSSGRILQILRNPCYGGAFAYGKTAPRTVIEDGRARTNRDIGSRKMSGRSCLWTIIRGTSIGRSIWRISDGWRRMWRGAMEKAAAPLRWVRLCFRACCAVAVVGGSCR